MSPKNKFLWWVIVSIGFVLVVFVTMAWLFWQPLPPDEKALLIQVFKANFGYLFTAVFMVFAVLGLTLDWFFRFYIIPLGQLADEASLMCSVNPAHRVNIDGGKDVTRLSRIINQNAERYQEIKNNIREKIERAKADVESEKNIFAGLLSELPEGVLICNAQGRIILYNRQAKAVLGENHREGASDQPRERRQSDRYVGLGRTIYEILDKNLIEHALNEIHLKLERKSPNAASFFVMVSRDHALLKVEAVPVLDHERIFSGFILIFRDITEKIQRDREVNDRLRSLTKSMRASVSSIRSAAELLLEYPGMETEQRQSFHTIVHDESRDLSELLNNQWFDYSSFIKTQWPLVTLTTGDFIHTVTRRAKETLGVIIELTHCDCEENVKIDNYSLLLSMLFVLHQLKEEVQVDRFNCSLIRKGGYAVLDFGWRGEPIRLDTLRNWETMILKVNEDMIPLTLKEVVGHHDADIWTYSDRETDGFSYFRISLPVHDIPASEQIRQLAILSESRPEFYDFDLFNQAGQTSEVDNQSLSELSYTVFDTETTGLNPQGGDEIISIGAVRIVNGRILRDEKFDQLVDPQRELSWESIKFHQIQPEALKGQPTIDQVLPAFHRFVGNTVMVAHNAAFDMRMLQMKEGTTGIRFINPVLDTLLLSAVVHPIHQSHNLESAAHRMGIKVVGRHTALGDAWTTAELFLKLIRLLANKGIYSLKEARGASQKTYYARLKY